MEEEEECEALFEVIISKLIICIQSKKTEAPLKMLRMLKELLVASLKTSS